MENTEEAKYASGHIATVNREKIVLENSILCEYKEKEKTAYLMTSYDNLVKIQNEINKSELEITIYNTNNLETITIPEGTKIKLNLSKEHFLSLDKIVTQNEIPVSATFGVKEVSNYLIKK